MPFLGIVLIFSLATVIYYLFRVIGLKRGLRRVNRGRRTQGWIYAFFDRGQLIPTIKIGRATNLDDRMRAHKTAAPFGLRILCSFRVPDPVATEKFLHRRYASRRIRNNNEWFWLTPNILIELALLNLFKPYRN